MTVTAELIKKRFADELKNKYLIRYKKITSKEKFARDFHASSNYALKVSRETVRKWFAGHSFPDFHNLLFMINWLDLDMAKVFLDASQTEKNDKSDFNISPLEIFDEMEITPELIEFFIEFIKSLKNKS